MFRSSLLLAFVTLSSLTCWAIPATMAEEISPRTPWVKDIFFEQMKAPDGNMNNGLVYSVELHRPGQEPKLVDNTVEFASGDRFRLQLRSNFNGYAYVVLSRGTTGKQDTLFPPPGQNNYIEREKKYVVPYEGFLRFDDNPGKEYVTVMLSRQPISSPLTGLASAKPVEISQAPTEDDPGFTISKDGKDIFFEQEKAPVVGQRQLARQVYVVQQNPGNMLAVNLVFNHVGHAVNGPVTYPVVPIVRNIIDPSPISPLPVPSPTPSPVPVPSPAPLPVTPTPAPIIPPSDGINRPLTDKWALLVGIGQFRNPQANLRSPAKDAMDIGRFMVKEAAFSANHVRVLTDESATRSNILGAINWLGSRVRKDDLVVIYVSSHGTGPQSDGSNYVVPYDFDGTAASGIRMQDLGAIIKEKIPSDRVAIVLDVCYAGNAKPKSFQDSKDYLDEIMQGAGQIVVSACDVDETSLDTYKKYGNSLFTYHWLNAMRNSKKLKGAFDDAKTSVMQDARNMNQKQSPIINYSRWKGNDLVMTAKPTNPQN